MERHPAGAGGRVATDAGGPAPLDRRSARSGATLPAAAGLSRGRPRRALLGRRSALRRLATRAAARPVPCGARRQALRASVRPGPVGAAAARRAVVGDPAGATPERRQRRLDGQVPPRAGGRQVGRRGRAAAVRPDPGRRRRAAGAVAARAWPRRGAPGRGRALGRGGGVAAGGPRARRAWPPSHARRRASGPRCGGRRWPPARTCCVQPPARRSTEPSDRAARSCATRWRATTCARSSARRR